MGIFDWFTNRKKAKINAAVSKLLANSIDYATSSTQLLLKLLEQAEGVAPFTPSQTAIWMTHGEFLCFYLHLLDRSAFEKVSANCRQELLSAVPLLSFPSLAPRLAGGFTPVATQFAISLTQTYRQRQLEYGACDGWKSATRRGLAETLVNNIQKSLGHPNQFAVLVGTLNTLAACEEILQVDDVLDSLKGL